MGQGRFRQDYELSTQPCLNCESGGNGTVHYKMSTQPCTNCDTCQGWHWSGSSFVRRPFSRRVVFIGSLSHRERLRKWFRKYGSYGHRVCGSAALGRGVREWGFGTVCGTRFCSSVRHLSSGQCLSCVQVFGNGWWMLFCRLRREVELLGGVGFFSS